MSQHDMSLANAAGAAFRADLNDALAALVSNSSGATAPSTTFAYQWWADTTTGLLKIRNAANSGWVTVGTLASTLLGHQAQDATLDSLSGLSLAQGDILYATAADTLERLPKGTAGHRLAMNGGATAPSWGDTCGYVAGSGGTVTQSTSKSTGVTLNKKCGRITTSNAALASGAVVSFVMTNSFIEAGDGVVVTISDGNGYKYDVRAYDIGSGSCSIAMKNDTAGSLSEALPINFQIIKGTTT